MPEGMKTTKYVCLGFTIRRGPLYNRRNYCKCIFEPVAKLGGQHLLMFFGGYEPGDIHES